MERLAGSHTLSRKEAWFKSKSLHFDWSSGFKFEELQTAPLTEITATLMKKAIVQLSWLLEVALLYFFTWYSLYFLFQGFLNLRLTPWIRNFLTRCLAIVPSLIVALIGGSSGAGKLIIIASVRIAYLKAITLKNNVQFFNFQSYYLHK